MTIKDQVIELAKQSGCPEGFIGSMILEQTHVAWIERFYALVRNAALEECLLIADQCADADMHASMAANVIRAMKEPIT